MNKTDEITESVDGIADQLGVVLVWKSKPGLGRYGYLTPFRWSGFSDGVIFFGEKAVANPAEIAEGLLVQYQIEEEDGRRRVSKLAVKDFNSHDARLDFEEEDILGLPSLALRIVNPSGPVLRFILSVRTIIEGRP